LFGTDVSAPMPDRSEQDPRISFRVSEDMLAEINETWAERGYMDRSEFIRAVLRDELGLE